VALTVVAGGHRLSEPRPTAPRVKHLLTNRQFFPSFLIELNCPRLHRESSLTLLNAKAQALGLTDSPAVPPALLHD